MAISVTDLIPEFSTADLGAYVENYQPEDLAFKSYFPSDYTTELNFKAIQAKTGAKVAANIVAFDASVPLAGRNIVGTLEGEIPKIELGRKKKETDINIYKRLQEATRRSRNPQALNALIEWMYGDSKFALDAVNSRVEWIAKQITSKGKFTLTVSNNAGGVVSAEIDFGVPSGNKFVTSSANAHWSDTHADVKPISDIRRVANSARVNGHRLRYAIMDNATFLNLAKSEEAQKLASGYVASALSLEYAPSVEQMNRSLQAQGLPEIIVWDSYVNLEDKDGTQTAVTGWETGHVAFVLDRQFGSVQWTDTADSQVTVDSSNKAFNDFVLVKMWAENNPLTVVTKGVAYAIPVLGNSYQHYLLNTESN